MFLISLLKRKAEGKKKIKMLTGIWIQIKHVQTRGPLS